MNQLPLYRNILSFWIYKHCESDRLNCGVLCSWFVHFNQCLGCKFVSSKGYRIRFDIICCCVCSDSWSFLDAVIEVEASYFKRSQRGEMLGSPHDPGNSPEGSILFPPTTDKMIPSKLQFDHSRESSVKSLINTKRRKKKKKQSAFIYCVEWLFSQRHTKKKKRIWSNDDGILQLVIIANIHSSKLPGDHLTLTGYSSCFPMRNRSL